MLPPPPVLAPPVGTAVAVALSVVSGVGAGVCGLVELGTGAGLDGAALDGGGGGGLEVGGVVGGGVVGGGVGVFEQVGVGFGVGLGLGV